MQRTAPSRWFWLRTVSLTVLGLTLGDIVLSADKPATGTPPRKEQQDYLSWQKPQAVLFLTGYQYGYIEPCGCTGLANQKGGLARRQACLASMRERGWSVLPLDAGNQVRRIGAQSEIKFQATADALRGMKYGAVGLGPDDLRLAPGELIAAIAAQLNDQQQSDLFISANANPLGLVATHRITTVNGLKVGVTSVIADDLLKAIANGDVAKESAVESLRKVAQEFKTARCQFTVLLAQASVDTCREWAKSVPGWNVIVSADGLGEPAFQPEVIKGSSTWLIQAGAKGMYVNLIGIFATPQAQTPLQMRYQRVALDAQWTDAPEMLQSLATYQQTLKDRGLEGLEMQPVAHPAGAFVGSAKCGECHTKAFAKWEATPHAHATKSIAEPGERSSIPRHHDPECLSCHVTGWNPQGIFPYRTGYLDLKKSAHLHGNGCENCHGPGQAHADAESGDKPATEAELTSLRKQMRLEMGQKMHDKCLECHDIDNSPDFHVEGAFEKYWQQIAHPGRD